LYLAKYRAMAAAYPQVLIAQRTLFQVTEEYVQAVERTWRASVVLQGFLAGEASQPVGTATAGEPMFATEVRHE
jgi:cobalt-zinc-cadmium efflux system outer membrane protein